MPKMKTFSGAKKRIKVTGSGKLRRRKAFRGHIMEKLNLHSVTDLVRFAVRCGLVD